MNRHEGSRGFTGVDVGVIGVAATRTVDPPYPPRSSWLAMEDYVALIDDRTPMRAWPLPLSSGGVPAVGRPSPSTGRSFPRYSSSASPHRSRPQCNAGSPNPRAAGHRRDRRGDRGIGGHGDGHVAIPWSAASASPSGDDRRRVGAATWADPDRLRRRRTHQLASSRFRGYPLSRLMEHNDILMARTQPHPCRSHQIGH